jgi:dihydrodipicolinate synthase/N-acetylneuraminate lyase
LPPAYFGKATIPSIVKRFFLDVASKAPLPVVIYNFPGVTNGLNIDSDTIADVVRASSAASRIGRSNVVGVKLTCAKVGKITRLTAALTPDEFSVFRGQADFLIGGLSVRSARCIAAFTNIAPKTITEIYRLYKEGKTDDALALHRKAALAESPCKSGIASTKFAAAISSATRVAVQDAEVKFKPQTPYEEASPTTRRIFGR